MASSLADETQKIRDHDEEILRWLVQQMNERGLQEMAGMLNYDVANLMNVIKGKRRLSGELCKRIGERITVDGVGSV